ncbi:MAG: ATP-binding cassette domain-containing protein, partial [Oscillospiraceae bacterium]|nr:ATP-binding cassette domain-containing protein [Oscillospiraceae bacterium]
RDRAWPQKLLETVRLSDAGSKKVGKFSMGMKQRLEIALALVGRPDLVILDEPINGLDPQGIAEIRDMIEELNRTYGVSFLISSHILEKLSKIATSYGFLHQGCLLQQVTREKLAAKCREHIELIAQPTERACTVLEEMGISDYRVTQDGVIQIFERLGGSGDIAMALMRQQVRVLSLCEKNEKLEDYYLKLTGGQKHV